LQPFVEDARRDRGSDGTGTTLTTDNENVLWENGRYGDFCMYISHKAAQQAVYAAFAASRAGQDATHRAYGVAEPHMRMLREDRVSIMDEEPRFRPLGALLLLRVIRDRFPRGDIYAHEPLMIPEVPYDKVPPEDWGERHGVGLRLMAGYEDRLVPGETARWQLDFSVQSRFDKEEPQSKTTSRFTGLVRSRYAGSKGSFQTVINDVRHPSDDGFERTVARDVATLQRLFGLAKDLRPLVTPIDRQLRSEAEFAALHGRFFSGDTASDS
jgi:hypothetical protein